MHRPAGGKPLAAPESVRPPRPLPHNPPPLLHQFLFKKKPLPPPFAIRSLTSLPASILGLRDRGRLVEGARADVVVLDPEELRDKATSFEPFQLREGIEG